MTATSFNALDAARDLEAAGVERRHADAIAEGMRQAADAGANAERADLATKADLDSLATKAELAGFIKAIEPLATKAEHRTAIKPLATKDDLRREIRPLRWTIGTLAVAVLAMAAKLFGIV